MNRVMFLAVWLAGATAWAEERQFAATVDGKPAGEVRVSFRPRADGALAVSVRTDAPADHTTEVWEGGRLVRLDGGRVTVREAAGGYHLKAPTKDVTVRGDVWPDTWAVLPERTANGLVVDMRTGEVHRSKVEMVGPDRVTVGGKPVPATRYRVTVAGSPTDLWYDGQGRLVGRRWSQNGRPASLVLTRIAPD